MIHIVICSACFGFCLAYLMMATDHKARIIALLTMLLNLVLTIFQCIWFSENITYIAEVVK
ncbi:MAG: hypothetical protein CVT92_02715 [Bacteroidetes bacterium HGW-Bacteroidetes-1]|nr:MAG: hypothetical protein CVT92_02715 [Bacteroidetes bacterium HGW-Bacteroidetes-1]